MMDRITMLARVATAFAAVIIVNYLDRAGKIKPASRNIWLAALTALGIVIAAVLPDLAALVTGAAAVAAYIGYQFGKGKNSNGH